MFSRFPSTSTRVGGLRYQKCRKAGVFKMTETSRLVASQAKPTSVDYSSLQNSSQTQIDWITKKPIVVPKNPKPGWKYGEGATDKDESLQQKHVEIDPFEQGRAMFHNYSLLVSGIAPRPIGFVSTLSKNGQHNLAPFSYFQVVDHDPPVFIIGFSGRSDRPKDTLRNLEETGECCFNVVSEHMIEAMNATSLDAPYGVSEWAISGLHQAECTTVKAPRVKEAIFSIEGKLIQMVDYNTSNAPVGSHGKLAIIEGTRFWVREDALDKDQKHIDLNILRPVGQLGGIEYARISNTFELPRSNWATARKGSFGQQLAKIVDENVSRN